MANVKLGNNTLTGVSTVRLQNADVAGEYVSFGLGGAELNIAYGDTAPTDTSKLWINAEKPAKVTVTPNISVAETVTAGIATIPTAAYSIGCAAVGTKIYLFGGRTNYSTNSCLSTINVFDTISNTITTLSATLPIAASNIGCVAVGTKIYLLGGYNNNNAYLSTINVFDTTSNTITTLSATLPKATYSMGCAAVGSKIYLFGGRKSGGDSSNRALSTINVFDTTSNTITTLSATVPTPAYSMGCAAVGTKIYLFGGEVDNWTTGGTSAIRVFDTTSNTITTLSATLPQDTSDMGCAAVGTKIYLLGGLGINGTSSWSSSTINVFDTTSNTITTLSATVPTPAYSMGCAAVGAKIYLFGGKGASNLNTINRFNVSIALTSGNVLIVLSTTNIFDLISSDTAQVQIGVDKVYKGDSSNIAELCDAYLHDGTNWVNVNTGEAYSA